MLDVLNKTKESFF